MKKFKYVICWLLIIVTLGTLCACIGDNDNSSSNKGESVESKVRSAVTSKGMIEYYGSSIGGNELKSSDATVSTVKKVSEKEYRVSGKMVMTDVYGTKWSNNFDCKVTSSNGEDWRAGSFEYTGTNWTKG